MPGGGPARTAAEKAAGSDALPEGPFQATAAEAHTDLVTVLSLWCGLVADERDVPGPPHAIEPLASYLARHIDRLSAHPAAAEVAGEVARLVRTARGVAPTESARAVRLGACVIPECGGTLGLVVPAGPSPHHPVDIQCSEDASHTWTGRQWTQLNRILTERAARSDPGSRKGQWLTADDVSRLWDIPVGTVYRLASEQRWRRRSRAGRAYYRASDVHRCFSRRTTRSS